MKHRETYQRKATVWDIIPGWVYGALITALFAFAIYMNWGW